MIEQLKEQIAQLSDADLLILTDWCMNRCNFKGIEIEPDELDLLYESRDLIEVEDNPEDPLGLLPYHIPEKEKPTIYYRKGEIHDNTYKQDSHPNDKKVSYKKGESKGRMKGLESSGWIGLRPKN